MTNCKGYTHCYDSDASVDSLAEDGLDGHFDGNVGDDLSPVSQVGLDDVTLEDGLVSHCDFTRGPEDHLDLLHMQPLID